MKLRIKGNSIRMRLTQTEIKKIAEGKAVQETLSFGGGTHLIYSLVPSHETQAIHASFEQREIRVHLPIDASKAWASSDQISLKHHQAIERDQLFILIEKDFLCLKPRQHEVEDESDLFPNPNEAHGRCG
jgi:hypothetical protein